MTQLRRLVSYLIGGVSITLALLLGRGEIALSQSTPSYAAHPRFEATYLDQGWGYDTAEWWYHVSQGTVFMPYQWFVALEQASGDALFLFRRDRWFESGSSSGESDERPARPLSP